MVGPGAHKGQTKRLPIRNTFPIRFQTGFLHSFKAVTFQTEWMHEWISAVGQGQHLQQVAVKVTHAAACWRILDGGPQVFDSHFLGAANILQKAQKNSFGMNEFEC